MGMNYETPIPAQCTPLLQCTSIKPNLETVMLSQHSPITCVTHHYNNVTFTDDPSHVYKNFDE